MRRQQCSSLGVIAKQDAGSSNTPWNTLKNPKLAGRSRSGTPNSASPSCQSGSLEANNNFSLPCHQSSASMCLSCFPSTGGSWCRPMPHWAPCPMAHWIQGLLMSATLGTHLKSRNWWSLHRQRTKPHNCDYWVRRVAAVNPRISWVWP